MGGPVLNYNEEYIFDRSSCVSLHHSFYHIVLFFARDLFPPISIGNIPYKSPTIHTDIEYMKSLNISQANNPSNSGTICLSIHHLSITRYHAACCTIIQATDFCLKKNTK